VKPSTLILAAAAALLALHPAGVAAQTVRASHNMTHARPAGVAPLGFSMALVPRRSTNGVLAIDYPVVKEVTPGSNAARAGLFAGDTILAINGRDARQLPLFPDQHGGTWYVLRVRRGMEERMLTYVFPTPAPLTR
jgi:S1-C subfamily serine protease